MRRRGASRRRKGGEVERDVEQGASETGLRLPSRSDVISGRSRERERKRPELRHPRGEERGERKRERKEEQQSGNDRSDR